MELTSRQESVLKIIWQYHREQGFSPTVREICEQLGLAGPAGVHRILKMLEQKGYIKSTSGKKRSWRPVHPEPLHGMPVLGEIAAGEPLDIWDNMDEQLPVDPAFYGHEACFAVRVAGDSMIGMHIRDGDLAVIRPHPNVENGEIVAVLIEEMLMAATLKIIRRKRNVLALHSANPAYPTIRFSGKAREKVRILGKYVGLIRRPKLMAS